MSIEHKQMLVKMTTELKESEHHLRHHGKHHLEDLWRTTSTSDVMDTTEPTPFVCYTTNEVLVIIGLTCMLNLVFVAVVVSCVHFWNSPVVRKMASLESLVPTDNTNYGLDTEEEERKEEDLNLFHFSPVCR